MFKYALSLFVALVLFLGINGSFDSTQSAPLSVLPPELTITSFTGPDVTPSPACLAVAPTGEVFVGVDMMGSLGKKPGYGRIIKLIDKNNDGKADAAKICAGRCVARVCAPRNDGSKNAVAKRTDTAILIRP